MERGETTVTSAEALVALAVQGRVSEQVGRQILQAVYDSEAGQQAFNRNIPPRTMPVKLPPPPREPEYLHPLGLLQDDLVNEYLEMEVNLHGENVLLRGYVISDAHELLAWLSVRPSYYSDGERPPLLRALAGMALLDVPDAFSHYLTQRHSGSTLLNAVKRTYAKRRHLQHPSRYLATLLKNMEAAPTDHAI